MDAHRTSPIASTVAGVSSGKVTAESTIVAALGRIREEEGGPGSLHAFLSVAGDDAIEAAIAVDRRVSSGDAPPLAGVAIAVKDNICTIGLPTTCGSRILEGYRSPFEATAVRRLRAAGAIIVGKTNLDEFAMGSSTENSAWGPTRNPHDRTRVPGGSSGGSAAAVAAGLVPAAIGSDTGGSVRQPASFCGVAGIKPTYGRVSRYGLVAFGSSLDQIGTFGRTLADATLLLQVISGHDPLDSTSAARGVSDLRAALRTGVSGLTIGVPGEYFADGLDPVVAHACERALEGLEGAGARIREISLPHTRYAIPAYYVIAPAEASSNLARYDGVRYGIRRSGESTVRSVYEETRAAGFGAEVKRRIMLGTFVLSAGYQDRYYGRAQRVRRRIAADFSVAFGSGVDAIFTPTSPVPAFRIGEKVEDPYRMYLSDVYTVTANLAGVPAVSVPIGSADGLPIGGQVIADHWREDVMLAVAASIERTVGK